MQEKISKVMGDIDDIESFLNYLPSKFIYISDEEDEIYGIYDCNSYLLTKEDGDIIGQLTPERMIELLQNGRLSARI